MLASQIGAVAVPIDRVLCSAARLFARTLKFGHVSSYMMNVLQQRISYRIIVLALESFLRFAPPYLRDLCCTTLGVPGRRFLRSAEQSFLIVSAVCMCTYMYNN